ncbi:queuosine salvage family protein [Geobacter sp. SVR]|uniref:queuosine salvage family protein n=1 Tax=Geobacter sp. SVR TaxID=2495594 RepID=UPI00143EFA76|nr:queuosine salvage family protein [Geobacter sp. SVR]BCS56050.1 hypothetical protein GSVR_43580 [Geobacter sp. SVR]GCF84813.1 hypothetical protein GSbR_14130 [Geobacter sp. SVR]
MPQSQGTTNLSRGTLKLPLLEEVRRACRQVAEQADSVEIDTAAIDSYAAALPPDRLLQPEMEPAVHYLWHGRETVAYYFTLGAVNFGSGYFPEILTNHRKSGYRLIAAALTRHFAGYGPIPPENLRRMSLADCTRLFRLKFTNHAVQELMKLYTRALNDLGGFVCDRFDGDFSGVVEAAGRSVERLVQLLASMPLLDDRAHYRGMTVPFYKRAQLNAADLCIAFAGQGVGRFDDIDRLTICADNLVPHVLRQDGILRYRDDLAERIDRGEPLAAGSPEEVEIRTCSVYAGELLVEALQRRGVRVNAMTLDNFLWHRGQGTAYRARPRHLTRTTFY